MKKHRPAEFSTGKAMFAFFCNCTQKIKLSQHFLQK